jgi:hypothetical protein
VHRTVLCLDALAAAGNGTPGHPDRYTVTFGILVVQVICMVVFLCPDLCPFVQEPNRSITDGLSRP